MTSSSTTGAAGWLSTSRYPTASCTSATWSRPCASPTPRTSVATAPSTPTAAWRQTARQRDPRVSPRPLNWKRRNRSCPPTRAKPTTITTTEPAATTLPRPPPTPTAATETTAGGSSRRCQHTRRRRKGMWCKGGAPGGSVGRPPCCGNATRSPHGRLAGLIHQCGTLSPRHLPHTATPPTQRSPVVENGIAPPKRNLFESATANAARAPLAADMAPLGPPPPRPVPSLPRPSLCTAAVRGEDPPTLPQTHGVAAVSHPGVDSDPFLPGSRLSALNEARGANRAPPVTTGRRCAEKRVRGVGVRTGLCRGARGCGQSAEGGGRLCSYNPEPLSHPRAWKLLPTCSWEGSHWGTVWGWGKVCCETGALNDVNGAVGHTRQPSLPLPQALPAP